MLELSEIYPISILIATYTSVLFTSLHFLNDISNDSKRIIMLFIESTLELLVAKYKMEMKNVKELRGTWSKECKYPVSPHSCSVPSSNTTASSSKKPRLTHTSPDSLLSSPSPCPCIHRFIQSTPVILTLDTHKWCYSNTTLHDRWLERDDMFNASFH